MHDSTIAKEYLHASLVETIRPLQQLWLDEFAYRHRELTAEASAYVGRFDVGLTPPMRDVYRAISDCNFDVQTVVCVLGAQNAKTDLLINAVGQAIVNGGPTMVAFPSRESLNSFQTQRLNAMFNNPMANGQPNPVWEKLRLARETNKRAVSNMRTRQYPGGLLSLVSTGSSNNLNGPPMRRVFYDEVDRGKASVGADGPPVPQLRRRTNAMPNRKLLFLSTPTVRNKSPIQREFCATDMGFCYVPCPFCGWRQVLRFQPDKDRHPGGLYWETSDAEVMYLCENCKGLISEDYKIGMLKQYEWRGGGYDKWTNLVNGHAIPRDTMARGFHMSTLYSPFYSWSEIRRDWLKARNVPSELQGFYNLTLAELYDSQDIASIVVERTIPEHPRVKDCGAGRNVECPPGSVAVTMGADVQRDRIEISAIAWGEHERGTVIDHHVCYGRTETKPSVPDSVWQKFTEYLLREFTHSDKKGMRAVAICVDTGYAKVLEHVHDWFRNLPPKLKARVILIKGDADPKDPHATLWPKQATASKESVQKWGHAVTNIRVDIGKDTVFRMLEHGLDGIESECLLFADNPVFDSEYFRGVYSEEKITNANGLDEWVQKVRKNEPLDCIVYGLAALRAWVSRGGRLRDHSGLASTRVRRHSLAGATEPDGDTWV